MQELVDLLKQSVILQFILTLGIWGVTLYKFATGEPVPDPLLAAATLILGFYFASKDINAKVDKIMNAIQEVKGKS